MNNTLSNLFRVAALFAVLSIAGGGVSRSDENSITGGWSFEAAVYRAFDAGDYQRAADLLEKYLDQWPNRPQMHYNLACAYSQLGRLDEASSALYKAVETGFRSFEHMKRDPDLAAVRETEMFRAIVAAADRQAKQSAENAIALWKTHFGEDGYQFEIDETHRLVFATALDDVAHGEMRDMLQRQADQMFTSLFEAPPDYYVLVAVPTPEHADRTFHGDQSIGGRYDHAARQLIARDIGSSIRHEFVHAVHYGHMEQLGLNTAHPLWVQEGLATLYEHYELDADGSITFSQNDRDNVVNRLAKIGRLMKWRDIFNMTADQFMASPGKTYPHARAIFEYLHHVGKLPEWYRTYVRSFDADQTGSAAFEAVFEKPLEDIEEDWRQWLAQRPLVDMRINSGDASLGVESRIHSANDGVEIVRIFPGSAARRAGLKVGDIIVSIDGTPTRSIKELQKVIGTRKVGDIVQVRLRRKGEYQTVAVTLKPLRLHM